MKFLPPTAGCLCLALTAAATPGFAEGAATPTPADGKTATAQADEAAEAPTSRLAVLGVAVAETRAPAGTASPWPIGLAVELTVSGVHPGSPAELAGLQTGDILLKLDDQHLLHPVQLQRLVARLSIDQAVTLVVRRGDETLSLDAKLAAARLHVAPQPGGPEGFEPMFRVEPLRMGAELEDLHRMQERMQQRLEQLFEAPDLEMPEGLRVPLVPMPDLGGGLRMQGVQVIDDGRHRLTLTTDAHGRHLKAVAADGSVLFEGPINTHEERQAVPEAIREKIPTKPVTRPAGEPAGRAV